MKKICRLALCLLILSFGALSALAQDVLDLSGSWEFQIDRDGTGVKHKLYKKCLGDVIYLPGSMAQRLKGDKPSVHTQWTGSLYDSSFFYNPYMEKYRREGEDIKLPFFLTPDRHYIGKAWYKRSVVVPASWKGRRVVLFVERAHITTTLWVNGKKLGMQNSLCVPHEYDVTDAVKPGINTLAFCVDNNIDQVCVGQDSHSVTDQTQGNWNGLVGRLELRSTPRAYLDDVQVFPEVDARQARVRLSVKQLGGKRAVNGTLRLQMHSTNTAHVHVVPTLTRPVTLKGDSTAVEVVVPMGDGVQLWDEFNPALYVLTTELTTPAGTDKIACTFGMRKFRIKGKMFYVNDRPVQLRGTVENCDFPLTGYAPMDEESWERVFRICKNYGLNHMRFHSFCPPEAAFAAADKVGFYLQPEGPSWPNHGVKLGNGMFIDRYLMEETQRINRAYGNHASFCMLACGNEPAGNWVEWVTRFVDYWERTDPRHVYTGASVGGGWAWQPRSMYHVKAGVRGLDNWRRRAPETMTDFREKIDTVSVPFVSHETGQWCAFPNFDEISKYTGVNKARNFEIFRDLLRDNGMGEMAHKFLMASGKLQVLCYKHEIERTLRTPDYAGFQLLALNDYSGQGSALVGPLDVFFEEKGYVTASEFREFCAPTVLLARIPKFTYWEDEPFTARLEAAHFGRSAIENARLSYVIKGRYGKVYAQGLLPVARVVQGQNVDLGEIPAFEARGIGARQLTLEVTLTGQEQDATGTYPVSYCNHWDFFVYPRSSASQSEEGIHVCDSLDEEALTVLKKGGKVLVQAAGRIAFGKDIVQQYTPVFWNTSWFKMRPPHTTGLYIESKHPIFRHFPTDYWSNLQWWDLVNRRQVMQFSEFPVDFQPLVQSIDTWFLSRKIGMLFEANVGGGRLVMTTLPIEGDAKAEEPYARVPAVAQMRRSILEYMQSPDFRPVHTLDVELIQNLFTKEAPKVNMYTKGSPDELKPKLKK